MSEQKTIGEKEAEAALKTQLLEAIPDAIFLCDMGGNLRYANQAAYLMFGCSKDEISTGGPDTFDLLRHVQLGKSRIKTLLEKGEVIYESEQLCKDRPKLPIELHARIVNYGEETLIAAICHDITERVKLEQQLVQSAKLSSLGTMSAGVAHEIKNPLAIIVQGTEFLESSLSADSDLFDIIKMIKLSSLRANKIVKDLLSFARQTEMEDEQVDLIPVIEETLSLVERQFSLRNTNIIRQFKADLPMINIDSAQIKQVFINILLNAIEAMQDGGTITISADKIKGPETKDYLRIIFKDTGSGISNEEIQNVFDPFFSTKKKSGGTGLGLSVSKGIIEKHNGYIQIESFIGKGTSVIIDLPCS